MSKSHFRKEVLPSTPAITTRLGTAGLANNYSDVDIGKWVKVIGESAMGLCSVGDPIEAYITSVEAATSAGFSIGGVQMEDSKFATADGLQGTPGTGVLAIGDLVVCGTVTPRGTALPAPARVCKATSQNVGLFNWRVVSLGTGAGVAGTTVLIEEL